MISRSSILNRLPIKGRILHQNMLGSHLKTKQKLPTRFPILEAKL